MCFNYLSLSDLDVIVPRFSGRSWIQTPSQTVNGSLEVAVSLSTTSSSGVIFLLANTNGHFVTVGLINDQILVQFDFGLNPGHHFINTSISDGEWHLLELTQTSLNVDGTQYPLNISGTIIGTFDVFIGSIPSSLPQSFDLMHYDGFTGSIIEFQLQNAEVDLIDVDINIGRNVGQSVGLYCSYVSCANGGTCQDTLSDPWFRCECSIGYNGTFCEVSTPFCTPDPCNGGECAEFEDRTFVCSCPLGYEGRLCDERK